MRNSNITLFYIQSLFYENISSFYAYGIVPAALIRIVDKSSNLGISQDENSNKKVNTSAFLVLFAISVVFCFLASRIGSLTVQMIAYLCYIIQYTFT